jgi:hypothetical protein
LLMHLVLRSDAPVNACTRHQAPRIPISNNLQYAAQH